MSDDILERVATLEAQFKSSEIQRQETHDDVRTIKKDLAAIRECVSKFNGFKAGLVFAFAAISALVVAAWEVLKRTFGDG